MTTRSPKRNKPATDGAISPSARGQDRASEAPEGDSADAQEPVPGCDGTYSAVSDGDHAVNCSAVARDGRGPESNQEMSD